jgi:hypothetical protein
LLDLTSTGRLVKLGQQAERSQRVKRLVLLGAFLLSLPFFYAPPSFATYVLEPAHVDLAETTELQNQPLVNAARFAKEFGVSQGAAAEYLERRPVVGKLYSALQTSGPESFDEMYFEYHPTYRLVILSTSGDESEMTEFAKGLNLDELVPFIEVRKVEFTTEQLVSAISEMEKQAPNVDFVAQVNVQSGTVWFSTESEQGLEQLTEAARGSSFPIPFARVQIVAHGLVVSTANSFGGLDLNLQSNHNPECTAGFSVEQTDGGAALGVATAAHCDDLLELNSGQDLPLQAALFGGSVDSQWHTTPNYTDQPWVRDGGTSHRTITNRSSRANQMLNDLVCISKHNDTVACGHLESKTFDLGTGFNATFMRLDSSTTLVVGGDSGGPCWASFAGTPGQNHAYGTTVAYPNDDPTDAIYMAQNYMSALNVRPMTGSL